MTDADDWQALADAVKARRKRLRLPLDLVDRGGPGEMTMRKIERGEPTSIRPKTKVQLEHALRWPYGITDRILDGTVTDQELEAVWGNRGVNTHRLGQSVVDLVPAADTATADLSVTRSLATVAEGSADAFPPLFPSSEAVQQVGRPAAEATKQLQIVAEAVHALFEVWPTPKVEAAKRALIEVLHEAVQPHTAADHDVGNGGYACYDDGPPQTAPRSPDFSRD